MAGEADAALRSAVADALGRPVGGLLDVRREPLEYDAFLAHRSVTRLTGQAIVAGDRVPWSLIEKRTEGPGLAEPYLLDNGRREFDAYRSGLLDDIAPGIRAPRVHGSLLDADGRITLWLEEVHHEGARPLDARAVLGAARDLGSLNGRWLGCRLDEPWYFTGWIDRHCQPGAVANGLATVRRSHPDAVSRLGERLGSIEHLILRQDAVRLILESMPRTLCHHDAVGANVFSLRGGTVLIDWESVGPGPLGADLASLLFSSVRRGDASIVVGATARRCTAGLRRRPGPWRRERRVRGRSARLPCCRRAPLEARRRRCGRPGDGRGAATGEPARRAARGRRR